MHALQAPVPAPTLATRLCSAGHSYIWVTPPLTPSIWSLGMGVSCSTTGTWATPASAEVVHHKTRGRVRGSSVVGVLKGLGAMSKEEDIDGYSHLKAA
ncbi:hypothetical protein BV22DRAFT_852201 [Leucogyrophana mollusca]|uniref:Uncharacterized protein n=1 Tax=Leucogyrophana mollusca TaxID=85980 RepID=A0ACB8B2F5_9AGAM|nr:hypothetical protein BV22DRAFT_852201 [Leucogyrophana mollusca]